MGKGPEAGVFPARESNIEDPHKRHGIECRWERGKAKGRLQRTLKIIIITLACVLSKAKQLSV